MKINEFYDQNIEKLRGDRYESGRKIHERRKMCELQREYNCPYENCDKVYASEGAVNLHIKNKHNGGNKTDREKLAKSLVYCKAKGLNVPDKLEINLPPQIVHQAAVDISKMTDVEIKEEDLLTLRQKLQIQNKETEKQQKDKELMRALQEADKARQMVEEKRCNPPKKNSRMLNKFTPSCNEGFKSPLPPKKARRDFDEEPFRQILGEKQNTMIFEKPSLNKEFSFGGDFCKAKVKQMSKENSFGPLSQENQVQKKIKVG